MVSKFIERWVFSSLHIAFIGGLYIGFYLPSNVDWRHGISAFSIILIGYNLFRFLEIKNYSNLANSKHLTWISKNFTELIITIIGAALFLFFLIDCIDYLIAASLLLVSLLYPMCRHLVLAKNVLIAIAWTIFPALFCSTIDASISMLFYFVYFCFLSIWYDLKDTDENNLLYKIHLKNYILLLIGLVLISTVLLPISDIGLKFCFLMISLGAILVTIKVNKYLYYMIIIDILIVLPVILMNYSHSFRFF